jgi:hypothetical protein
VIGERIMRSAVHAASSGAVALWVVLCVCACRATTTLENFELEGASLLGGRNQPGWENSSVPLLRFDGSVRPLSWPVGVQVSTTLSGYSGDETGEQSIDLGLGVVRSFEIVPDTLSGSLGIGHLFISTDNGELFANQSDDWQANYIEGGLYFAVGSAGDVSIGIEARYSMGDGPSFDDRQLDGDFLDVYFVVRIGPPAPSPFPDTH